MEIIRGYWMNSAERLQNTYDKSELETGVYLMVDGTKYLGEPVYMLFTDQENNTLRITFEDKSYILFKGVRHQLQ